MEVSVVFWPDERQGHPRTIFGRALERGNLMIAEITAREVGRIDLREALELTALIARQEPHRLPRVGARWLERFLTERDVTLSEALLAASALSALDGNAHDVALTRYASC